MLPSFWAPQGGPGELALLGSHLQEGLSDLQVDPSMFPGSGPPSAPSSGKHLSIGSLRPKTAWEEEARPARGWEALGSVGRAAAEPA